MLLLLIFAHPALPVKGCGVSSVCARDLCGCPVPREGAAFKLSSEISLHVALAYFFDPGILISCCHMSNLPLWQPFSVLHSLFALLFWFFLHRGLSTYTVFFLLVVAFPELSKLSLSVMKLFWILSI